MTQCDTHTVYAYTFTHAQTVKAMFYGLDTLQTEAPHLAVHYHLPGRTSLASFNHPQYNNEICSHIWVTGTAYESAVPAKYASCTVCRQMHNSPQAITPVHLITLTGSQCFSSISSLNFIIL